LRVLRGILVRRVSRTVVIQEPLDKIPNEDWSTEERFWDALLRGLSLDGWPLKMKFRLYRLTYEAFSFGKRSTRHRKVAMYVAAHVIERSNGQAVEVGGISELPSLVVADPDAVPRGLMFIRNQIREVVLHELDEQILFTGQRVFDPHEMLAEPSEREILNNVSRTLERASEHARKPDPLDIYRLPRRPRFLEFGDKYKLPKEVDFTVPSGFKMDHAKHDSVVIAKVRKPQDP
jgi:hypothetical protein